MTHHVYNVTGTLEARGIFDPSEWRNTTMATLCTTCQYAYPDRSGDYPAGTLCCGMGGDPLEPDDQPTRVPGTLPRLLEYPAHCRDYDQAD